MRCTVLAVGRTMPAPVRELVEEYQGRLEPCGGVRLEVVAEERRDKGVSVAVALQREAKRLQARLPPGVFVVALDASGKALSSERFAATLDSWRGQGIDELFFLIGGPDGLDPGLKSAAFSLLSLGSMTYPHMLARVLLFEQLYRAMTLLHGLPYHR